MYLYKTAGLLFYPEFT